MYFEENSILFVYFFLNDFFKKKKIYRIHTYFVYVICIHSKLLSMHEKAITGVQQELGSL